MLVCPNTARSLTCDYRGMRTRAERTAGDPRLGALIRARRDELGFSQEELAEAVERSRSHVANVELGRDPAGAKMLAGMAKKLGISLDTLMNSAPPGTPGTYTLTVTEEEANWLIAMRGLEPDEREPLTKIILRSGRSPKQS